MSTHPIIGRDAPMRRETSRTLTEAFGEGARLDVEPDAPWPVTDLHVAAACIVIAALLVALIAFEVLA